MDGYTLSISRCSGGDGVEESFKAKIKRREAAFGKRGLVLQHGEDDVSSFTLNPSWLSCEDETQRCIMVEIYLEP